MASEDRPYRSTEFDPCDQGLPTTDRSPDEEAAVPDEAALAAREAEEVLSAGERGETARPF